MKQKLNLFINRLLDTTLRELLLYVFVIFVAYISIRYIYIEIAYHFSDTLRSILKTVAFIVGFALVLGIPSYFLEKRDKKYLEEQAKKKLLAKENTSAETDLSPIDVKEL